VCVVCGVGGVEGRRGGVGGVEVRGGVWGCGSMGSGGGERGSCRVGGKWPILPNLMFPPHDFQPNSTLEPETNFIPSHKLSAILGSHMHLCVSTA